MLECPFNGLSVKYLLFRYKQCNEPATLPLHVSTNNVSSANSSTLLLVTSLSEICVFILSLADSESATLNEMFNFVYELMAPVQFKNYCISQRTHRWKLQERLNQIKATHQSMVGEDSKNGRPANVRKYSDKKGIFKAKDVKRAENTEAELHAFLLTVENLHKLVTDHRYNHFEHNMATKELKSNELSFYDKILKEINTVKDNVEVLRGKVDRTSSLLQRRLFKQVAEEAKRFRKRKVENKSESKREKKQRLGKPNELFCKIAFLQLVFCWEN